jgi:hypothetical protein
MRSEYVVVEKGLRTLPRLEEFAQALGVVYWGRDISLRLSQDEGVVTATTLSNSGLGLVVINYVSTEPSGGSGSSL